MSLRPQFLTPLRVEQVSETAGTWRLLEPLRYVSPIFGGLIVVPAGFVTDFASVPRLPFSFWLFGGLGQAAAVVHDYLYQCHKNGIPRSRADAIFDEALGALGVLAWRRWPMWAALRVGGWWAYQTGPKRYSRLLNHQVTDRRATARDDPPPSSGHAIARARAAALPGDTSGGGVGGDARGGEAN